MSGSCRKPLSSRQGPDWSILIGPEAKLPEAMSLGGDGGVAGGANVIPDLFVDCYQAIRSNHDEQLVSMMKKIHRFQDIYEVGKYASRHIKATKSALSLIGICQDLPADPFHRFLSPQRKQVEAILRELLPQSLKQAP